MIYFISNGVNIKIGYTKNDPQKRLKQLNTGSDSKLFLLGYMQGNEQFEKELHSKFSKDRIRFNAEWFRPSEELTEYINNNNEKSNSFTYVDEKGQIISCLKI